MAVGEPDLRRRLRRRPAPGLPKYGSLNFRQRRVGGSPRFGSAHLRLTADSLARATFCYPDSAAGPERFGIAGRVSSLVKLAQADDRDPLDDYIEAHVRGPIDDFTSDVEALVLDPCYRATRSRTGRRGWAARSSGTAASPVPPPCLPGTPSTAGPSSRDWRGRTPAAERSPPRLIGDASRAGRHDEQALKRVWHYVAHFGNPGISRPPSLTRGGPKKKKKKKKKYAGGKPDAAAGRLATIRAWPTPTLR